MSMIDSLTELVFNVHEAFTVALFLKEEDSFRCLSSVTFAKSFDRDRRIPIEGTLPGWVLKHDEPLIIPNFDKDESTLGYYGADEEIKSFMAYPLEVPGVIVVDSKKRYVFTDREKKLLGHFVSVIGKELEKERRFQDIEERNEELSIERRIIGFFRESRLTEVSVEEVLEESLAISQGDFCFIGLKKDDRLHIADCTGNDATLFRSKECPVSGTIAAMVLEGGREFLLPHNSGYLKERPLLYQDDGIRARQFFGFPFLFEDEPFGLVAFVSTSQTGLNDGSIALLRDIALLLSLYLVRAWTKGRLEKSSQVEPVTGALPFSSFFRTAESWIRERKSFSVVSIKLADFTVYNRLLGVEAADRLLRAMFQSIEQCLGKTGTVTRAGGSHFYAVSRDPQAIEAENLARILNYTIQSAITDDRIQTKGALQIGVTGFPEDDENVWTLLSKADERRERYTHINKGARA
jgi:diguanylate cyclase (GGDEF)-like protein